MPTLVNNLRAIRGPVTAVPVTPGSGIEIAADTENNQIVISTNLEAGSGIDLQESNGKVTIINSDNANALPIVAGTGVKLSVVNNQVVVSADETVLWEGTPGSSSYQITLSENLSHFEYFVVEWKSYERRYRDSFNAATTTQSITLGACFALTDGNYEKSLTIWGTTDGTTYTWKATIHGSFQSTQSSSWNSDVVPLRIIGINRLSN